MKLACNFCNFDGCLTAVLKQKWELCVQEDETFGTKPNAGCISDKDIDKICEYVHLIDAIMWSKGWEETIQQVVYWLLGLSFCLRGRNEHHSILCSQVVFGKYGKNGPPGMENVP